MKREIYDKLLLWKKQKKRKPLLLQGARQVGKTYTILQFAKEEYKNYVYLDFEKNEDLRQLFKSNINPDKIITEISFFSGIKIQAEETLIIFDEIQASEEAITSLKYFNEETPEYHIIAAGSLLGVAVGKNHSFPVGKVNFLEMYPMSFSEYLSASNEEMLKERIVSVAEIKAIPEIIHQKLIYYLKQYLFVGGMPEVLQDYINNKDVKSVRRIQKEILKAYQKDFSKYSSKAQAIKTLELWNSIPYQLSKENKKFKYMDIKTQARASRYEQTIEWLKQAGLVNIAYNISSPKFPLSGYSDKSKFKIYILDTGLLGAMLDLPSELIINPTQLFKEYNGAFIENFVAMELKNIDIEELFYWTSRGEAEVDFIINYKNKIYPIEVKSGTSRTLKSLRSYQKKYKPEFIFRCSPRNYSKEKEFVNFPLYS
ncbi:MAG: ATP-binding protein, partial [Bacteroidota bacterium]|nr:ATP-binding protein [Bacteroidota bacterium]